MSALKVCLFLALVATVTCANNGAVCNSDSDCTVANAVCVKPYETCDSGFCGCDHTYYQTSVTTCKKAANIGEACETPADCTATTFDSQCTANVCECTLPEAQHVHTDSETGMKYCYGFLAGEACSAHEECLTNSYNSVAGKCVIDGLVCGCEDRYVLADQQCVGVTYGSDCEIDATNDRVCESNTECLAEGATRTCQCGVSETWSSSHRRCQHDSVTTASEGDACNNSYESSSGKICSAELVCVNCPGETDDVCQRPVNGATAMTWSVFSFLSLILFAANQVL